METPTGRSARPTRTATPRLSERKKQLFRSRSSMLDQLIDDSNVDDPLLGIAPLKPMIQRQYTRGGDSEKNTYGLVDNRSDGNGNHRLRLRSSTSSSPETNKENKMRKTRGSSLSLGTEEQLPHLFTTTMHINSNSSTSQSSSPQTPKSRQRSKTSGHYNADSDDSTTNQDCRGIKRKIALSAAKAFKSSPDLEKLSPQSKLRKTRDECIPTGAFYSNSTSRAGMRRSNANQLDSVRQKSQQSQKNERCKVTSPNSRARLGINKGVHHKIRKTQRYGGSTGIDDILNSLRNEKLRQLITTKREERAKVEQVHQILRSAKDPIKMAKPLSVVSGDDANNNNNQNMVLVQSMSPTTVDFSDLSDDEEFKGNVAAPAVMELEPVIPIIRHDHTTDTSQNSNGQPNRKFFKSGRRSSTCMEVRITDNIRASVTQGKIALVEAPLKKQRQVRIKSATIFSAEQATVDAILRNLDDTIIDEIVQSDPVPSQSSEVVDMEQHVLLTDPYDKYRQKLPYQTDDPTIIEQQMLLLEFLISNDICSDENFEIFIANPENHKEEATQIVDNLYEIVNAQPQMLEESDRDNKIVVAKVPISMSTVKEKLHDNATTMEAPEIVNMVTKESLESERAEMVNRKPPVETQSKLFPIFTQRLQPLPKKSLRRNVEASARLIVGASGSSQYQIDAGQKSFGARQCHQCGLIYTVHEPEEEQLHREYHDSVHVLRFKGWIDEDIVGVYSEWATDGRIIRINELAPAPRMQRLTEVIKIIDKELGFSSYIVPKTFIAYIAVRKQQIVGLCLVQPLSQAHRFIQVDGTDYFSEDTIEASCGVSRIWVSPLHRRKGIGSKLLRAVQYHTIMGIEISRDRIAFSTPTDDGRALARQFTQNDNFLTYEQ